MHISMHPARLSVWLPALHCKQGSVQSAIKPLAFGPFELILAREFTVKTILSRKSTMALIFPSGETPVLEDLHPRAPKSSQRGARERKKNNSKTLPRAGSRPGGAAAFYGAKGWKSNYERWTDCHAAGVPGLPRLASLALSQRRARCRRADRRRMMACPAPFSAAQAAQEEGRS